MEYTAKIGDLVWLESATFLYAAVITDVYVQKYTSTVNGVVSEHEQICVSMDFCTGERWYDKALVGSGCSLPASYFDGRFLARPVFRESKVSSLPYSECLIISHHSELKNWLSEKAAA